MALPFFGIQGSVTHSSILEASLVAQMVKNLPAVQETKVPSLGREIPWRRAWQPTPVFLSGESHGQRCLVGYSPWDRIHRQLADRSAGAGWCWVASARMVLLSFVWPLVIQKASLGLFSGQMWNPKRTHRARKHLEVQARKQAVPLSPSSLPIVEVRSSH